MNKDQKIILILSTFLIFTVYFGEIKRKQLHSLIVQKEKIIPQNISRNNPPVQKKSSLKKYLFLYFFIVEVICLVIIGIIYFVLKKKKESAPREIDSGVISDENNQIVIYSDRVSIETAYRLHLRNLSNLVNSKLSWKMNFFFSGNGPITIQLSEDSSTLLYLYEADVLNRDDLKIRKGERKKILSFGELMANILAKITGEFICTQIIQSDRNPHGYYLSQIKEKYLREKFANHYVQFFRLDVAEDFSNMRPMSAEEEEFMKNNNYLALFKSIMKSNQLAYLEKDGERITFFAHYYLLYDMIRKLYQELNDFLPDYLLMRLGSAFFQIENLLESFGEEDHNDIRT